MILENRHLFIDGTVFFGHELTYMKLGRDILNFLASGLLLATLLFSNSSLGISRKTQCLYLLASLARVLYQIPWTYLDYELLHPVASLSICLLLIVLANLHQRYEENDDPFRWKYLLIGTAVLAMLFNYRHLEVTARVVCWAWAHYLDAVAILPQLVWLAISSSMAPNISVLHIFVNIQAVARILSIIHWTYMYFDQDAYDHLGLISDFFHLSCHIIFLGYLILQRHEYASRWRNRVGDSFKQVVL